MNKRKADAIKGATHERLLYRHLAQPSTLDGIRGGLTHLNEKALEGCVTDPRSTHCLPKTIPLLGRTGVWRTSRYDENRF